MINYDLLVFSIVGLILSIPIIILIIINIKVRNHVFKNYKSFWEGNIGLFGGGGKGGPTIFKLVEKIKDKKIEFYKKKWELTIKILAISVVIALVICLSYIGFFK